MTHEDTQRYQAAAHAMQSGVAMEMNYLPSSTEPKHLRVGVNSAHVSNSAIAGLLIDKGIITLDEYEAAVAGAMETEAEAYRQRIQDHFGGNTTITLA